MNKKLLFAILGITTVSAVLNAAFILHELGLWPHGKDRKHPHEGTGDHDSNAGKDYRQTHDYTISHPLSMSLRKIGHKEIYKIADPVKSLENVIQRYKENPVQSRLDDCVFLTNEILSKYPPDNRITTLVKEIGDLIISEPVKN